MHPNEKEFASASTALEEHDLRSQLALIHRIHVALRTSLRLEDLRQIILALLISDLGLGFDHAFFLEYDPVEERYRGATSLGTANPERHQAIRREILEEHRLLLNRVAGLDLTGLDPSSALYATAGLQDLEANAFWIDAIQRYSEDREWTERFRNINLPCGRGSQQRLLCTIARSDHAIPVPLGSNDLPESLREVIALPALAARLQTRQGVYGIVIVDRGFSGEPDIPPSLVTLFEWFMAQASLALENALLFGQKEMAFEQLQQIEMIKSNFLSTISHELRTPLTAIAGFTQVLLQNKAGDIAPRQCELLRRIERHTAHLGDMVDDLLELAEENSETLDEHQLKPVDPLAALMAVIPQLEHRRRARHVTIEPCIAGKIPPVLATDKIMQRVLFHLLDNAVKFSPADGKVLVRFEPDPEKLRIEIEDFGIGIPQRMLKQIFKGFFQVDNRLARSYQGLGIGLTLTKKLLTAIGGKIRVHSQRGEGTTVAVELRIPAEERIAHAV